MPDRIEFDLTSPSGHISQKVPAKVNVAGHFLYGAPAADLDLEGEVTITKAKERAGFPAISSAWPTKRSMPCSSRSPICPTPTLPAKAPSRCSSTSCLRAHGPLEAQITVRMAEPGGRAVERKITLPVTPTGNMIGVKPLFSGRSLADGANAAFDVIMRRARRRRRGSARLALRTAAHRDTLSILQARRELELRAGQDDQARRRRHD